jgi:uncharacterized membrane protein YdjX (TVP38/TMEM64 family)
MRRIFDFVRNNALLCLLAALALLLIGSVLSGAIRLEWLVEHLSDLKDFAHKHYFGSLLVTIFVVALVIGTGIPTAVIILEVVSGAVYGTVVGSAACLIGAMLGGSTLFIATRSAIRDNPGTEVKTMADKLRAGFLRSPWSYAFALRVMGLIPFGALTVALAWLRVSFALFFTTSYLGILPSLIAVCSLGASISRRIERTHKLDMTMLHDPKFVAALGVLGVLALIPAFLSRESGKAK